MQRKKMGNTYHEAEQETAGIPQMPIHLITHLISINTVANLRLYCGIIGVGVILLFMELTPSSDLSRWGVPPEVLLYLPICVVCLLIESATEWINIIVKTNVVQ